MKSLEEMLKNAPELPKIKNSKKMPNPSFNNLEEIFNYEINYTVDLMNLKLIIIKSIDYFIDDILKENIININQKDEARKCLSKYIKKINIVTQ